MRSGKLAGRVASVAVRNLNKLSVLLGWHGALERRSQKFWASRNDTHIAGEAYYAKRVEIVQSWLRDLPHINRALDVGSGDGEFTLLLAGHADHVAGFDISSALVEKSNQRARDAGILNVEFYVAELEGMPLGSSYDLVSCLGVTSCVLDEDKYHRVLDALIAAVAPGGHLLMIDTVGIDREHFATHGDGYVARYRHVDAYIGNVVKRGLRLVRSEAIQDWSSELSNRISLFQRP